MISSGFDCNFKSVSCDPTKTIFAAIAHARRHTDPKIGKRPRRLIFLTNNFALPALTIIDLYRCRWQAEPFFKWIN
jgi:IS4 transposase